MKRLTTDDSNSILLGINLFFVKDREVWSRGGGPEPDYPDCTLTDWINRAAAVQGIELGADDAESLGDVMYDWLQYGVDATEGVLALLHAAAVQAAEMRGRLAPIEDILGDDYDIDRLRELVEACKGLEPSEIAESKLLIATRKDLEKLARMAELMEADREGRAVVLPCKPGDTINAFRLGNEKALCVISDMVISVTTNRHGWTVKTKSKFLPIKESDGNKIAPISQYPYALADYYVGPREAAEAALKGEHDGVH